MSYPRTSWTGSQIGGTIPEPATLSLLAAAAAGLLRRNRRRR